MKTDANIKPTVLTKLKNTLYMQNNIATINFNKILNNAENEILSHNIKVMINKWRRV